MSEQELNKKLAEWQGHPMIYMPYTDSLDLCVKWLVPKLRKKHIYIDLNNDHPENRGKKIWWAGLREYGHLGVNFWETEETPALALCRAIEKLIDAEK